MRSDFEVPALFEAVPDTRHGHLGETRWETAHARRDDLDTSHQAAASVRHITDTQNAILTILQWRGALTDEQIAEAYRNLQPTMGWPDASPSGLRSRRAELVDQGRARAAVEKGRTAAGRACHKWEAA